MKIVNIIIIITAVTCELIVRFISIISGFKIQTITFLLLSHSKWEIRIERHTHNHKNIPSKLSAVTIKYPRSMVNSHSNELFGPIRKSHL